MNNDTAKVMERKIQAGELQSVQASEEVMRRNVESVIKFSTDTRKLVNELKLRIDSLNGNVANLSNLLAETRQQLAILQQQSCAKGTKRY